MITQEEQGNGRNGYLHCKFGEMQSGKIFPLFARQCGQMQPNVALLLVVDECFSCRWHVLVLKIMRGDLSFKAVVLHIIALFRLRSVLEFSFDCADDSAGPYQSHFAPRKETVRGVGESGQNPFLKVIRQAIHFSS